MMNRSVNCKLEPSRRELFGGLTILTVLACVLISRDGRPRESWADPTNGNPTITPTVLVEQTPTRAKTPALVSNHTPALQLANEQSSPSIQP